MFIYFSFFFFYPLKFLQNLVSNRQFDKAGALCPRVLGSNGAQWENWIYYFAKEKQLEAISKYIPISNPQLPGTVYEMVLNYYLLTNLKVFQETVSAWPASLYDVKNIINVVLEKLKKETNAPELMLTLAELYEKDGQYSKALHIYLRLRRGDVFSLIEKYNLFSYIQDKIVLLMEFDPQQAVTMLVKNVDKIDIGNVTEQLKTHPFLLHQYLDTLFNKDPHVGADYHILQVCEGKESV